MHVPELGLILFRDSAKQIKCLLQNNYLEKMLQKDLERTMCFSMVCLQCIIAGLCCNPAKMHLHSLAAKILMHRHHNSIAAIFLSSWLFVVLLLFWFCLLFGAFPASRRLT